MVKIKRFVVPGIVLSFLILTLLFVVACAKRAPAPAITLKPAQYSGLVKIKWLGHAAFMITSSEGTRIITDPYAASKSLTYGEIGEPADIVTVSHDHRDHNNVAAVGGNPEVVRGTTEVKGIRFKAIPTYHDNSQGKERGNNTVICFEVDGLKFCHSGDLGHLPGDNQIAEIGKVDILFIPVGGHYTIDAGVATQVCNQLKPSVILPMHYKTDRCIMPISGVDEFLQGKENASRLDTNEIDLSSDKLTARPEIIVLKPAR